MYILGTERDSNGYCSLEQAALWETNHNPIEYRDNKPWRIANPDWHTPSWLSLSEFDGILRNYEKTQYPCKISHEYWAVLAAMQELHRHLNAVRLVFWFVGN